MTLTSWQHTESYLLHLASERRLSPDTIKCYRRGLENLLSIFVQGNIEPSRATASDIRTAVRIIRKHGLAAASMSRHLSIWRGFFSYAVRRLGYPGNPCINIKGPKLQRKIPTILTPLNCAKLLDGNIESWIIDGNALLARDRAMFETLYSCGLRVSELTGLNLEDIDLITGEVRVTGKGSRTRVLPIGMLAARAINCWLIWRKTFLAGADSHALFLGRRGSRFMPGGVRRRLMLWAERTSIGHRVNPHMLRHAFATHLLQSSGDLRAVQEMLGHAQISTTQIYTHLDWLHLARTYDRTHPRGLRLRGSTTWSARFPYWNGWLRQRRGVGIP